MKKPERKWLAILAVLAGMAWGAAAAPPAFHKNASNEKSITAGAM
jgi:hypothetical protein